MCKLCFIIFLGIQGYFTVLEKLSSIMFSLFSSLYPFLVIFLLNFRATEPTPCDELSPTTPRLGFVLFEDLAFSPLWRSLGSFRTVAEKAALTEKGSDTPATAVLGAP